ncbi:MAG: patatin-like phospholipase family protein [Phocaeicola sp.]|uniref:patatin-like phospholipase family protein n=1 Tax=Phocaeicola sp. TaxID=2773926 RepID=UPI003FA0BC15
MMFLIDDKTGLVLEGGGMRGVFTCGVLDYLLDENIYFPYTIGVSAGACNGLSYMSRQRGRAKFSNIDMLDRYHYLGIKYLWSQHSIMNMDLLYNHFPEEILPYDYKAYEENPARFEMVTTSCVTGRAVYLEEKHDRKRIIDIVRASASLPFACPVALVDGEPMLDGGIVDSIPLERAVSQGCQRNVVVLTRNKGFRKKKKDFRLRMVYKDYPRLRVALSHRCENYNRQLKMVERWEDEGRIIVIRPQKPLEVDRICKDTKKLTTLYEEGYEVAKNVFEKL